MKPAQASTSDLSLALYGGSFDPVHCAHLMIARAVLDQLALDRIVFIPAAQSPLKKNRATASDADRIEMLQLATAGEPRFEVDPCEIKRGGISYAVDTVNAYVAEKAASRLYWIIGADQLELLPKWHCIEEIVAKLSFVVLRRPGYRIEKSPVPGLNYIGIDAPLMPHSSSEVRALLAEGQLREDLVPPAVEAFISARGLYTREK